MLGMLATGAQAVLGVGQTIAGLVKKKPEIPEYDIPQEVYENMTDAEYWALEGMPAASKAKFIQESKRTGATALSRSAERKGGLGLISSIAQQERDDATNMLSMDAEARMNNMQNLYRAREAVSGEKEKKFAYDREKTMAKRDEINNLIGSGLQNIMGAAGTGAAVDAMTDGDGEGIFSSLFGNIKDHRSNKKWAKNNTVPNLNPNIGMTSNQVKSALDLNPYPYL